MKRPTPRLARVTITEKAPDPDQVAQELIRDPGKIPRAARLLTKYAERQIADAPLVEKGRKWAETERTFAAANKKRQHKAGAKYESIKKFARGMIDADPKLGRATVNKLANKINKLKPEWPKRTIRRALEK